MSVFQTGFKFPLIRRLFVGFLDVVFPPFCRVCGNRLQSDERVGCHKCWQSLEPTDLGNWKGEVTYSDYLDAVYSGWFFDEVFQEIIHSLKYHEFRGVAVELGVRLADIFGDQIFDSNVEVIIPVPLHPARHRERGFNQSALIAESLAGELNIPYRADILGRGKNTVSQTQLSAREREKNMSGAFLVKNLSGFRRFLVVDDVLTSGATLSSCAQTLKANGAEQVTVLTAGTPHLDSERQLLV